MKTSIEGVKDTGRWCAYRHDFIILGISFIALKPSLES